MIINLDYKNISYEIFYSFIFKFNMNFIDVLERYYLYENEVSEDLADGNLISKNFKNIAVIFKTPYIVSDLKYVALIMSENNFNLIKNKFDSYIKLQVFA